MNFYGQAESTARSILAAFQSGNLPAALAPIFIRRTDDCPCRKWSWGNQLIAALHGTSDARGFGQWLNVQRAPRKGSKAFHILAPVMKKIETTDASGRKVERLFPVAFKTTPVFRVEDTDGEALPVDTHTREFIDALPFLSVAKEWKIDVASYSGRAGSALGKYCVRKPLPGLNLPTERAIALGVENLATWAHELIHAADDQLGHLVEKGQALHSETVAEFGASILLECAGLQADSDLGGAYLYIQSYARAENKEPIAVALQVLNRTCEAVALVLDTAEKLKAATPAQQLLEFAQVA